MKLESKNLYITFSGTGYVFNVTPEKEDISGKLIFEIDMGDKDQKTIHYSYSNGWWQLTGKQIYTDILHLMGGMIERNYPELF